MICGIRSKRLIAIVAARQRSSHHEHGVRRHLRSCPEHSDVRIDYRWQGNVQRNQSPLDIPFRIIGFECIFISML